MVPHLSALDGLPRAVGAPRRWWQELQSRDRAGARFDARAALPGFPGGDRRPWGGSNVPAELSQRTHDGTNVAFSQPYYSRHPVVHLLRGETKPFLKAYYNTVAGLADRETYTFWEHFFHASAHKTHEEAWFLMDTRWMLYLECGQTLHLLSGIPRKYLEDGKQIAVHDVASYFGSLSFRVVSEVGRGRIEAVVDCASERHPERLEIRLPHPMGLRAVEAQGGVYDRETERVTVEPFRGRCEIALRF